MEKACLKRVGRENREKRGHGLVGERGGVCERLWREERAGKML